LTDPGGYSTNHHPGISEPSAILLASLSRDEREIIEIADGTLDGQLKVA
jgi:hypothetical protein